MKLNRNCMLDVMRHIESNLSFNAITSTGYDEKHIFESFPNYEKDDLKYVLLKLTEVGYITRCPKTNNIKDITFKGHDYLKSNEPKEDESQSNQKACE